MTSASLSTDRLALAQTQLDRLLATQQPLFDWLATRGADAWLAQLAQDFRHGLSPDRFGDLPAWLALLDTMPTLQPASIDFACEARIGTAAELDPQLQEKIQSLLLAIKPWRKGPFSLYGIGLDAEWRSDLKWNRFAPRLGDLRGRSILDIGCGNGYYMLRMLGQGADRVLGIDPTPRYLIQFEMLRKLAGGSLNAFLLPLAAEQLPPRTPLFDLAFSMGVLYHRREPLAHLAEIAGVLQPDGQLLLETLVLPEDQGDILVPRERYAQMRNVWAIPSLTTLTGWLGQAGYRDIELLDVSQTSTAEQRRTPWMDFQSLADFLDPADANLTVEGYPAPRRAALLARW